MKPVSLPRTDSTLKKGAFREYARSEFDDRPTRRQKLPFLSTIKEEERRIKRIRERFRSDIQKNILLENVARSREDLIPHLHEGATTLRKSTQGPEEQNSGDANMTEEPPGEFKAGLMYFEKTPVGNWCGKKYEDDSLLSGDFPNQKMKMKDILSTTNHQLFKCEPDKIKYFHFPANHMEWIEASPSYKIKAG
jgi:hypothetical protein